MILLELYRKWLLVRKLCRIGGLHWAVESAPIMTWASQVAGENPARTTEHF